MPKSGVQIVRVKLEGRMFNEDIPLAAIETEEGEMFEQILNNYTREQMGTDREAFFKAAWSSVVGWGISERVPDPGWMAPNAR